MAQPKFAYRGKSIFDTPKHIASKGSQLTAIPDNIVVKRLPAGMASGLSKKDINIATREQLKRNNRGKLVK